MVQVALEDDQVTVGKVEEEIRALSLDVPYESFTAT